MPGMIDVETLYVDDLPTVWSPVQWELSEEERVKELHEQATASLLWAADAPEAILRLLLSETAIERLPEPPQGYDPEEQGEWDESLVTFGFERPIEMQEVRKEGDTVTIIYKFGEAGYWSLEMTPKSLKVERI